MGGLTNDEMARAQQLTQQSEGLRFTPYSDTVGKITIGWGRNLTSKGISAAEARVLFVNDWQEALADVNSFSFASQLNPPRFAALVDMRFNLGPGGFREFKGMIANLEAGDFQSAAHAMIHSAWHSQNTARCERDARMMRTGEW